MAVFRRLVLMGISIRAFSQGLAPTDGCAQQCEPRTQDVSLLQLNGVLKAIESALDLPAAEQDGHLIHTPNGPRVAHMSHLPVQAVIPDQSALVEAAARDESRGVVEAVDLHTEDPHHDADPHAVPAPPPAPPPHAEPPPAPHPPEPAEPAEPAEPHVAPTRAPADVKEGYENAHPAELTKEKYAYLNGLAAFAIGPGIFFLGLLVVTTFGLFVYAYKNDPRVFG